VADPAPTQTLAPETAARFKEAGEHFRAGRLEAAAALLETVLSDAPGFARGWHLLGFVEGMRGRFDAAAERLAQAVALEPGNAESHYLLAKANAQAARVPDALSAYEKTIALAPGHAAAHTELGVLLQAQGDLDGAIQHHRRAAESDPRSAIARNNLGAALRSANRPREAVAALREAAELERAPPEVLVNLGNALKDLGAFEEAAEVFRRGIAAAPGSADLQAGLGTVLAAAGRSREGIAALEGALALAPEKGGPLGRLIREKEQACDWADLDRWTAQARALLDAGAPSIHPFVWASRTASAAVQRRAADRWAAQAIAQRGGPPVPVRAPRARDRIRIGYLSANLHEHAVAYLLAEVIELHDRTAFEAYAYSCGPGDASAMRRRLEAAFDVFADVAQESDRIAAQRICDDEIDILVDLMGYTERARTAVIALRPAPLVVNFLGYPGTLGAGLADYLIGDAIVTPLAAAEHYAEKLVVLPASFQPNDRKRAIAVPMSRAECGLPEAGLVLCSFNQSYKFTAPVLDVWCEALQAAPDAVLWLAATRPIATENLHREVAARGVDPARLVSASRVPRHDQHLARLACADLFLDTFPFNAHTTASDALWAGVPVLTRAGESFASRVAASLLRAVGLGELVTESAADYRAALLGLVADRSRLASLRGRLAAARATAPLFDSPRYTRDLERAYLAMWQRALAGARPEHIVIPST